MIRNEAYDFFSSSRYEGKKLDVQLIINAKRIDEVVTD
jgi:hypothetical protein